MEIKQDEIINFTVELVSTEVLFESKDVEIKVEFFWDSHGKMIPFPGGPRNKKTFSKKSASVKITKNMRRFEKIERLFEDWSLEVDGVLFNAEVFKYSFDGFNTIKVKAIVGSG